MDVTSEDTTSPAERHVRDIEIHGGVNNWYIDVRVRPILPDRYRLFLSSRQVFRPGPVERRQHAQGGVVRRARRELGERSGAVPADLQPVAMARHDRPDRRDRPPRPVRGAAPPADARPVASEPGTGALASFGRDFHFELDAELIVYGTTEPNAKVTLQGEPVQLRRDGTFTVRFSLPDSRQIIPAVAASPDGVEERTIVLAVERNTKELEPMIHDGNEL